jgi:hypothetical protein
MQKHLLDITDITDVNTIIITEKSSQILVDHIKGHLRVQKILEVSGLKHFVLMKPVSN